MTAHWDADVHRALLRPTFYSHKEYGKLFFGFRFVSRPKLHLF